mmetsp:Transcript_42862/g.56674  ORF Transcript_42862/g.56674 Transcript_42862/m.56674 type:complete len:229 (+) Transcript_42862:335-1021(+)
MDGNLALLHSASELLFNGVCNVEDGLSGDTVEDAAVVGWRDQLHVAQATLLEDKNVQDGHLLDVVVQQPQHVVKAIHFGVRNRGHQRAQVATHAELTVTQRPVFVHVVAALETDRLLLEQHGVEHDENFGGLGSAHTQGAISREVHHAGVELVVLRHDVEPVLVELHKRLHALHQLFARESRHVEVSTRLNEVGHVLLGAESLQLVRLCVLHDRDAIVDRDSIMQNSG